MHVPPRANTPSDTWYTEEVCVQQPLRLGRPGSSTSTSSSTSSLQLEVSRLASVLRRVQANVNITAVDFCTTRCRFSSDLHAGNLGAFLQDPRPPWSAVRWLLVDGVSGDVLQTLAHHYDLHPLALEDVLNFQRIKAVTYPGHLYIAAHIWQLQKRKTTKLQTARTPSADAGKGSHSPQQQQLHHQQQPQQQLVHRGNQVELPPSSHPAPAQQQHLQVAGSSSNALGPAPPAAAGPNGRVWEWLRSGSPTGNQPSTERAGRPAGQLGASQQQQQQQPFDWRVNMPPEPALATGFGSNPAAGMHGGNASGIEPTPSAGLVAAGVATSSSTGSSDADDTSSLRSFTSSSSSTDSDRYEVGTGQTRGALVQHPQGPEAPQQQQQCQHRRWWWGPRQKRQHRCYVAEEDAAEFEHAQHRVGGGTNATHPEAQWEGGHTRRHHHHDITTAPALPAASTEIVEQQLRQQPPTLAAVDGANSVSAAAAGALHGKPKPAAAAAAPAGQPNGTKHAAAGGGSFPSKPNSSSSVPVELVLPLRASGFRYQPTLSPFKRKRVMQQQVSMFLHSSGVLITIFPGPDAGGGQAAARVAGPVLSGLRGMSSLLLESEDAGFLMQALLRSCISYSLPVFSRLADVVLQLDRQVLGGKAAMGMTWRLHVLQHTLNILARSFNPTQALLETLVAMGREQKINSAGQQQYSPVHSSNSIKGRSKGRPSEISFGNGSDTACAPKTSGNPAAFPQHTGQLSSEQAATAATAALSAALDTGAAASSWAVDHAAELDHWIAEDIMPAAAAAPTARNHHNGVIISYGSSDGSSHRSDKSSSSSSSSSLSHQRVEMSSLATTYIEDLLDQAVAVSADLNALSDHVGRLASLVVTSVSHSTEQANITLAIIATFFLPLTFIAGVYGMNFDNMPELHWHLGYMYAWLLCVGVVLLALLLMWYTGLIKVNWRVWRHKLLSAVWASKKSSKKSKGQHRPKP